MMITRAQINYRAMVVVLPAGTVIGIMLQLAGARWVLLFVAVVTVLLCLQFRRDGVDGAAASVPSFPVQVQQRGTTIMTPSVATAASVPAVPVQVQQRGTTTTTPSVAAALPRKAQTAGLRGLGSSASVVAVLPVYTWSKKAGDDCECAICLGEVRRGQVVKQLPACTHLFHTWCIDKWLTSHVTCPVCRTPVDFSAAALHGVGSHHSNPLTARGTAQR